MQYIMLIIRIINPFIAFIVLWTAFCSFRRGLRKNEPVIFLRDIISGELYPVRYWENSIGRSKTCDIVIDNQTVSRDHAVLLRRKKGWFICDTGSKSGVGVFGEAIETKALVDIDDEINIGNVTLKLEARQDQDESKRRLFFWNSLPTSPWFLVSSTLFVHFLMALQLCFRVDSNVIYFKYLLLFLGIAFSGYFFCFISTVILKRKNFEIETIGFLLSGIGLNLLSARSIGDIKVQFVSFFIGMFVFLFLIIFMSNADIVTKWRLAFALVAILIFVVNMVIGKEINGSKNWIFIGGISIQPSELVKIAFVIVGTSTLDKLQTNRNIGEFIAFAGICMGFLFIMRDFGSACIYFSAFLVIAFMRSGNIRTIALIVTVAVLGAIMILYFKPYVAQRFEGWGNIWEHINDSLGYQQTRTLTYIASGGLFGMGLGEGYLHYIAASESDLVFGLLCEEQGLLMALVVCLAIVFLGLMAISEVRRSRSAFYSIASCGAVTILIFQASLNIFGSTDILPLTGVTLPFISAGGTSMIAVWGLLALIKASDERTYNRRGQL